MRCAAANSDLRTLAFRTASLRLPAPFHTHVVRSEECFDELLIPLDHEIEVILFGRTRGDEDIALGVGGRNFVLGLGRTEHAEQRRPGGDIGIRRAVLLGGSVEAGLVLASVADGELVILIIAEIIPEVVRDRVVAVPIGIVVRMSRSTSAEPGASPPSDEPSGRSR